ncbi:MAG TPA: 2-oxoacid:acceptor oxidoreductase family protein [Spirochaetota bacterium]|nr:2-oxoacid:acceptor oxidoreductase family protein [Spirochaetota bacterium]HPR47699.1 2-oxoacid:acceptor oxidoreductase family protein [Spirochaetota bacterium]
MTKFFEVRWHGRGGQGTVTGAKSLAEAVQGTGKFVSAFPDYGPERRGAPLRAYNRFSGKPIRIHTPVHNPDVVIVVDHTLIRNRELMDGISDHTIFIVNTEQDATSIKKELMVSRQRVLTVPANNISYELFKREIPNSAVMGSFARACPNIISIEKLIEEAEHIFASLLGKELVKKNLEAIRRGYEEGDIQ